MAFGLLGLPIWGYVIVTLLLTHITIAAVTIFLHRHQSHRALDLHPLTAHFFRFWLWLTTGIVTKEWVAVHRKHHALVETRNDPHSPQVHSIKKVLLQGSELYKQETRKQETLEKYGHGTPDDWIERHLYTKYDYLGLGLMLVLDVVLFGLAGITMWAVQMLWIPVWAAGVVNGVGHWGGYRNYETADASTNIFPFGVLIGGEELHNNHHAFAGSAKLSSKWWEIDIGWWYIRVLSLFGLAHVKKVAPKPVRQPCKRLIDTDTVRAIIINRLHVMADYTQQVVGQVYREELKAADVYVRSLLKPVRSVISREDSLITEDAKRYLERVLELNPSLDLVYQFKLKLQQLWSQKSATPEALLFFLQDWCRQAESTGIKALEEFSCSLRSYTLR